MRVGFSLSLFSGSFILYASLCCLTDPKYSLAVWICLTNFNLVLFDSCRMANHFNKSQAITQEFNQCSSNNSSCSSSNSCSHRCNKKNKLSNISSWVGESRSLQEASFSPLIVLWHHYSRMQETYNRLLEGPRCKQIRCPHHSPWEVHCLLAVQDQLVKADYLRCSQTL